MYENTLKLKLTVCTSPSLSLYPFKLKVLEYRTKITKKGYCPMNYGAHCMYVCMYVQLKSEVYIHRSQIHLNSVFHNS